MEGAQRNSPGFDQLFHGFVEVFGGGQFAVGADDGGAAFTFGFGLFGHNPFHVGGNFDILNFDGGNVNTPIGSFLIDDGFDFVGKFLALGQERIELNTADNIAKGGLGVLSNGVGKIFNFENSVFGLDDLKVNNGVDTDRDIVFGNDFLLGDINSVDTNVDFNDALDNGEDQF